MEDKELMKKFEELYEELHEKYNFTHDERVKFNEIHQEFLDRDFDE